MSYASDGPQQVEGRARISLPPVKDQPGGGKSWRPSWFLISFIIMVVVPSAAIYYYFLAIASNQYISETRFVVRQTLQTPASDRAQGAALGNVPVVSVNDNAYIVTSYINSRAIVDDLLKTVALQEMFRRPEADFWSRLRDKATIEQVADYWLNMVTAEVDSLSGIVTVRVRAFRPEDALTLTQTVTTLCTKLVNDVSIKARDDALRRAQEEVKRAEDNVRAALTELEAYRDREGLINPVKSAEATGELLKELVADLIATKGELFVAKRLNPGAPTVAVLASRAESLNARIAELSAKLAGNESNAHSIATQLVKFEELSIKERITEEIYVFARNGLERARQNTERRWVYLSIFVPPSLPEESLFPKRFTSPFLFSLAFLILWSIGALTWASVEDHSL